MAKTGAEWRARERAKLEALRTGLGIVSGEAVGAETAPAIVRRDSRPPGGPERAPGAA